MGRLAAAALGVLVLAGGQPAAGPTIRVCADPDNLPFSDRAKGGFENKIVDLLAKDLGAKVQYVWWAQQRGFVRNTLGADLCDLLPGVPVALPGIGATEPYYRSMYVFVSEPKLADLSSFDDPRLPHLKTGVQLIGDSGYNTPPAQALARRGLTDSLQGFPVYDHGNARSPIVDAVENGIVDIAVVWGPTGGYFAAREPNPLHVRSVSQLFDGPRNPMVFDVAMGVQLDDTDLRRDLDAALSRHRGEIRAILDSFNVPQPPETSAN